MAGVHQNSSSHAPQIYVFKVVNIDCCEYCPRRLEKALRKLDGVESVHVDATQCLARVKGVIDSTEIINTIKKWKKEAELVKVEFNDDDEGEKEDCTNASCGRKDSSFLHKHSFFRKRDKNKGSSHAPEKHDHSKSNVSAPKEIPDHICRDKYCAFHKRDEFATSDPVPNMNYGTSYSPSYRGGGNHNYPRMNSYRPHPPMYPPPPQPQYGQYYGQRMFPQMAGYGSFAAQRPMPRPRSDGFINYSGEEYRNGCNNM